MFGHEFDIDGGDDGVHHHAQYGSGDLNDQITGIAAEFIGRGGTGVDALKKDIEKLTKKTAILNIVEVKSPDTSAQLVAENIAAQLERRISYRRAMKQAMQRSMKAGAKGIKTMAGGRLGGADIARSEGYHEGTIPLQTLRADIDYGFAEANTTFGKIGVKVWIYKGEVLPKAKNRPVAEGGN